MTRRWTSVALFGVWVTGACGGEESTAARPACTGPVTMVATREARPLFTWTPDCIVAGLRVEGPPFMGLSDVRWAIRGGNRGIASGVRFDVPPRGAVEEVARRDLSGFAINVAVFGADGVFLGAAQITVP